MPTPNSPSFLSALPVVALLVAGGGCSTGENADADQSTLGTGGTGDIGTGEPGAGTATATGSTTTGDEPDPMAMGTPGATNPVTPPMTTTPTAMNPMPGNPMPGNPMPGNPMPANPMPGTETGGATATGGAMGTGGSAAGAPPLGGTSAGGTSAGGTSVGGSSAGGAGTVSGDCVLPDFPDAADLPDLGVKLPDPFTFYDGTKVTTKAQWECRRQEILAMAAKYLYGPIPGDCDEVSGSVDGGNISISCTVGGTTESFSASISGSGEAINLNLSAGILPQGKSLSLGNGNEGKIRDLYGLSELNPNIANAWMVNRVMDVLELNPDSGHDPTKLAVSGCSGCGKGAFFVGVFSRIPITVIVESGGGGGTSWRMTEWFTHGDGQSEWECSDRPQGIDVLEETGICGPWVTSAADSFRSNPETVNNLPFDQHLLLATIAPRYLVHFTNSNFSWCWLAGTSEALASWAAHSVYNALGVPENHSFEVYDGGHCGVGDTGIAAAMFDRALNGNMSADTGQININDSYMQLPVSEWKETFIDWDMDTVLQ